MSTLFCRAIPGWKAHGERLCELDDDLEKSYDTPGIQGTWITTYQSWHDGSDTLFEARWCPLAQ